MYNTEHVTLCNAINIVLIILETNSELGMRGIRSAVMKSSLCAPGGIHKCTGLE